MSNLKLKSYNQEPCRFHVITFDEYTLVLMHTDKDGIETINIATLKKDNKLLGTLYLSKDGVILKE